MQRPEVLRYIEKSERNLVSHSVWRPEIRKKLHQKPVRRRPDVKFRQFIGALRIIAKYAKEGQT